MKRISKTLRIACLTLLVASPAIATTARAHFPWLASDDYGHAVMWFGESPEDRTYPMPVKVQAISLQSGNEEPAVKMAAVETDKLVGIQSDAAIAANRELAGSVTYGLYHGMKLTYHVEHLPQRNCGDWPTTPRDAAAMQTVITPIEGGGIKVAVLRDGKPVGDTEVKLFCEAGHEEAAKRTDAAGMVEFAADVLESGLNALMVGVRDGEAKGTLDGEPYASSTDYLTSTFFIGGEAALQHAEENKTSDQAIEVDPNSRASVGPAGLPDLPEELTSFGAAIAGDTLFVYGGHTGNAHSYSIDEQSDRFWSLDLKKGGSEWEKSLGGPSLQGLALVPYGNKVVRIGGFTAMNAAGEESNLQSQTSVAIYDPANGVWSELAALPEPRSSLDAAVLGDHVYVFGGWKLAGDSDESTWHQTAWRLDLSQPVAWEPIAAPSWERRAISVAAHDGRLYVIGGMLPAGKTTTEVAVYDPVANSWSSGPAIPGPKMSGFGTSSYAAGGKLYVSAMDGFVHQLADNDQSWNTISKIEPARFFHRMLPLGDDKLLIIGGANMEVGKFTEILAVKIGK